MNPLKSADHTQESLSGFRKSLQQPDEQRTDNITYKRECRWGDFQYKTVQRHQKLSGAQAIHNIYGDIYNNGFWNDTLLNCTCRKIYNMDYLLQLTQDGLFFSGE